MEINYNEMVGHYFYEENGKPSIIIEYIEKNKDNSCIIYGRRVSNQSIKVNFCISESAMLKQYRDYLIRASRKDILKQRSIKEIVHFTKIENLDSIFEYGLASRKYMDFLAIDYKNSDDLRLDNKMNYISTSITFPNYRMFYSKMRQDLNQQWAVLRFNSSILLHKLSTEFYKTNRANYAYYSTDRTFNDNESLSEMFTPNGRNRYIPNNYTTDPQAEVLIEELIDSSYLVGVETNILNSKVKSLAKNIKIEYNNRNSYFTYRSDYADWR